jgi:hypothetical protein
MADVEVHIVAVGDGNVDSHLTFFVKGVYSLTKYEEKTTGIGTVATGRGDVEKLYLLLLIGAKVHTFHLIINVYGDRAVLHLKTREFVDLFEGGTHRSLDGLTVVANVNLYSLFHIDYLL